MIDLQNLRNFLGCDDQFLIQLMDKFIVETGDEMQHMQKALAAQNWPVLKRTAHKMLSSTRILELEELNSLLEKIEMDADAKSNTDQLPEKITQVESKLELIFGEVKEARKKLVM